MLRRGGCDEREKEGLQALMRAEVCPKAIYVHCYAHRLNLVVISSVFSIPKAGAFFDKLAALHKFFSATVPHDRFVQTQHQLRENVKEADALRMKELKSLSKTRWYSQAEVCDAVIATLSSIIDCAGFFAEDNNHDRRAAAVVILGFIDTNFIVNLDLFQDILRKSSMTANYLQSKEMDTAKAVELIAALKANL